MYFNGDTSLTQTPNVNDDTERSKHAVKAEAVGYALKQYCGLDSTGSDRSVGQEKNSSTCSKTHLLAKLINQQIAEYHSFVG